MRHLWIVVVCLGMGSALRADTELFTNVYVVPPIILGLEGQSNAKTMLEQVGIVFPEGASALYSAERSQLIVRNTQEQLELVEAYLDELRAVIEKQIFVGIFELSFRGDLADLLKSKKPDPMREAAPLDDTIAALFRFPDALEKSDKADNPVYFGSIEWLEAEMARAPRANINFEGQRKIMLGGIFTDEMSQVMLRRLIGIPGVKMLKLPHLEMLSGQAAMTSQGARRYGVMAVLGAKEDTTDLSLFLPEHGKAIVRKSSTEMQPTVHATIPDGNMAVIAEQGKDGNNRLVFVRSLILEKAGSKITPPELGAANEAPVELPTKSDPASLSPEEKEAVKTSDRIAEEASQRLAEGKFAEALELYGKVLNLLPKHEFTKPRREAYEKQLLRAKDGMAKRTSNTGVHVVAEGETLEQIAARLGIAAESLLKANRLDDAPLKHGQILLIPAEALTPSRTKALLNDLILPGIDFKDVNLLQAIMMLQQEILRLHNDGLFPAATPIFMVDLPPESLSAKITLRLSDVPAAEALRYIVSLAQCRYEVNGREVRIRPLVSIAE